MSIFFTALLLSVLIVSAETTATDCAAQTDIPQDECEALVDLYNGTDGPNWSDNPGNNWNVTNTPCSWTGVTCSAGHVGAIRRVSMGLNGVLSGTLGNLSNLQYLELFTNQLTGNIPGELGDLSNLRLLNLLSNQLTGNIPGELGNLSSLQGLSLASNQLTGSIPSELGDLSNLQGLDLARNQLTGSIPGELGNLSNLVDLRLDTNQLTGSIPSELGILSSLRYLYLSGGNQLTGSIPGELGNLSNLQFLLLEGNQLTGTIPGELGDLSNLKWLYLFGNQLTGSIPGELGNLSNLLGLDLRGNQLAGSIPGELGNLSSLQSLRLSSNQLTGTVPVSLTQLTVGYMGLDIGYNGLSAANQSVADFLDSKDPDWAATQTVPPVVNNATAVSVTAVQVNWQPISYTQDGGYYQVYYSLTAGGPYTKAASTTADKTANSYTVSGLSSDTAHYFVVQTHTPTHTQNQNAITSTFSTEVSATTTLSDNIIYLPLVLRNLPAIIPLIDDVIPLVGVRPMTEHGQFAFRRNGLPLRLTEQLAAGSGR